MIVLLGVPGGSSAVVRGLPVDQGLQVEQAK
jgi:hypothetical protein